MPNPAIKKMPASSRTQAEANHQNYEERIRVRAYELYEARGREDGHDVEDWLEAEAEIAGRTAKAAA